MKKGISFKEQANSFLLACLISIALIERIIVYFTNRSYILFYLSMILTLFILLNNTKRVVVNQKLLFLFGGISFWGVISIILNGEFAIKYIEYFICFFIPALLIYSENNVEYELVFKYVNAINSMYVIFYMLLYRQYMLMQNNYSSLQMEAGYNFVPCILIAVVVIKYSKDKKTQFFWGIFNIGISFIYIFLDCASRGPIISVISFFFIMYLRKQNNVRKTITVIMAFAVCMILIFNYEHIIWGLYSVSLKCGIESSLLNKLVLWSRTNYDLSNGRNILYEKALKLFKMSPVWGGGIGCFEKNNAILGLSYVHQYFLQILCESGIIGFLGAIVVLINQIKMMMIRKTIFFNEMEVQMGIVLFSLSMPRLMFSTSYWITGSFWLLLVWSLSRMYGNYGREFLN